MNLKRQSGRQSSTTMRDRLAEWRQFLEGCGEKPTRKRVHALRVLTLRLQAELEHDLGEIPHASHQAQSILQFGKQAEKLRRALGPVRELDVWIGKLQGLGAPLRETGDYVPRSSHACIRPIERLEDRLKRKRRSEEKNLVAEIGRRGERLVKAAEEVEQSLDERVLGAESGIAAEITARFRAVAEEFPTLDAENLHEFRKRIKMVRYLAEMHADSNPACKRIATQIKKLQSAIGEWHDWQALAHEVRHGHHAKKKPLAELLETLTSESFEAALSTAHTISARLLGESPTGSEVLHAIPGKLPARSDEGLLADLDKKLA